MIIFKIIFEFYTLLLCSGRWGLKFKGEIHILNFKYRSHAKVKLINTITQASLLLAHAL